MAWPQDDYYRRETDMALLLIRGNLRTVCDESKARKESGERFDSAYEYEAFVNVWRDCSAKLRVADLECARRGL